MRKDGKLVFYAIQAKYCERDSDSESYNRWFVHTDCIESFNWIPESPHVKYDYSISSHDDPTAGGHAWQVYGEFGVTNLKAAEKWLKKVQIYHEYRHKKSADKERTYRRKEYLKKYACIFRIVRITKTQYTEPIVE